MEATGTVTINLYGNAFENEAKSRALQTISNIDLDHLQKLEQLAKSAKAIKMLADKWAVLKMMLNI